jgi:hypothetical protein
MSSEQSTGRVFNEEDPIPVECCRSCASKYQFKLRTGEIATVLCGRPHIHQAYKAISYVWETDWPPQKVALECLRCSTVKSIPMRDVKKLGALSACMKGNVPVWLDAMSIDQDDEDDKGDQLAVMGDIYRRAQGVSVLLPMNDEGAYRRLKTLGMAADTIVKRKQEFWGNGNGPVSSHSGHEDLEEVADSFLAKLQGWDANVERWEYWLRCWTFQEWAMAAEIEVRWEGSVAHEALSGIKNVIVMATTIVTHWKRRQSSTQFSILEQMLAKRENDRYMHIARAHFPFEDFLIGGGDTFESTRRASAMPKFSNLLGDDTGVALRAEDDPDVRFRRLISLALNAMSLSKRNATNPADKVACWASMCNIEYGYGREDSYPTALHKVVTVLRQRGIPVYNWLANTDSAEIDLQFLDYSAAQNQSNSATNDFYTGAPIFIGRVDTVKHVRNSLLQDDSITHILGTAGVTLQQIGKVIFKRPVCWSSTTEATALFRSLVSGIADNTRTLDVANILANEVKNIDTEQLAKKLLVTVQIGVEDSNVMWHFNAWAIIPAGVPLEHLFVARESLNGTLVLAVYHWKEPLKVSSASQKKEETVSVRLEDTPPALDIRMPIYRERAEKARIVGYLHTTHQENGTYLLKVDDTGVVDVVFRTKDTPEPDLFWLDEATEMALDGLTRGIRDCVIDVKISFVDRRFTLATIDK